jgi:hypothetical protein
MRKNPIAARPASPTAIESIIHERAAALDLFEPFPELLVKHPPEGPHCFPAAHHSPLEQHVAPAGIQLVPQVVIVPVHPPDDEEGEVAAGLLPVARVVGFGLSVTIGSGLWVDPVVESVKVGSGIESAVVLGSGTPVAPGRSMV